ncbi:MAG: type IV pilus modification protein PilV [Proteobacteria bacterium]|nr:type IV pilus modification protein PilV [Pseudomonadota bacterium]
MKSDLRPRVHKGFTLIEVLVAILIVAMGVLGFAKMQALALTSSRVSSARSIVALQASSLAAAMHTNRNFWGAGTAPATFGTVGATVSDATGVLNATPRPACSAAAAPPAPACTPAQLAAYDVQTWAAGLVALSPTATSTTTCSTNVAATINCVLSIQWTEAYTSASNNNGTGTATADSAATGGQRTYVLYIQP